MHEMTTGPTTVVRPQPREPAPGVHLGAGPGRTIVREPGPRRPARASRPARDRRSWTRVLADGAAAAASDVDFDLRTRVRAVLAEAEQAIDDGDPGENWSRFDHWLRDRLTFEATRTCALLQERTAGLASVLNFHLDQPGRAPLQPPPVPPLPELFEHLPQRGAPKNSRRPLATRGRTLLLSAYGGVMMTFVLARLAKLAVPTWLLVAAALVAAVALSGASLAGDRTRQLERRRSRAKTLVRHCTDGYLLGAGKFTRDALRTAQQHLRDACEERDG
jgi:hypothetical protein